MKRFTLATLLALGMLAGSASAAPLWYHYRTPDGGPRLVVRAECIQGEDSANHLRVRDYSAARVVIGCSRKGY